MLRSLALCLLILAAAPVGAESVDEIVAKNVEARGGLEALRAVGSARVTGDLTVGNMAGKFTIEWKRPDKIRFSYEIYGSQSVQIFDGEHGWIIQSSMHQMDPTLGPAAAKPLDEDQTKRLRARADFIEGDLVNYRAKKHKLKLLGMEEVEGVEAFKLELTRADGDKSILYIDKEHHLAFRRDFDTKIEGTPVDAVASIGAYKRVGDILMSHSTRVVFGEGKLRLHGSDEQSMTIRSVDLDVPIADERFEIEPEGHSK